MLESSIVVSAKPEAASDYLAIRALIAGCRPVLPDGGVYPELLPRPLHASCLYYVDGEGLAESLESASTRPGPNGTATASARSSSRTMRSPQCRGVRRPPRATRRVHRALASKRVTDPSDRSQPQGKRSPHQDEATVQPQPARCRKPVAPPRPIIRVMLSSRCREPVPGFLGGNAVFRGISGRIHAPRGCPAVSAPASIADLLIRHRRRGARRPGSGGCSPRPLSTGLVLHGTCRSAAPGVCRGSRLPRQRRADPPCLARFGANQGRALQCLASRRNLGARRVRDLRRHPARDVHLRRHRRRQMGPAAARCPAMAAVPHDGVSPQFDR